MNRCKAANFEFTSTIRQRRGGEVKLRQMYIDIDKAFQSVFSQLFMPSLRHRRSCYLRQGYLRMPTSVWLCRTPYAARRSRKRGSGRCILSNAWISWETNDMGVERTDVRKGTYVLDDDRCCMEVAWIMYQTTFFRPMCVCSIA